VARTVIGLAVATVLLALAASAGADVECAPPGVSGISQYFETLPGVSCNIPSPRPGRKTGARKRTHPGAAGQAPSGGGGSPTGTAGGGSPTTSGGSPATTGASGPPQGPSLPAATQRQLSKRGATGQAVQQLVAQTGTAPPRRSVARQQAPGAAAVATGTVAGSGSGRGIVGGLLHPLLTGSSHGGAGVLFPVFLAAALVLMLTLSGLRRARRRGSSS
jgi:hypothetical protein